jgi:tetratricopeptide (TPR) repeat protein
LWDDTVKKSPHKARPRYNRGNAYYYLGEYALALADYNRAIGKGSRQKVMYENRALAYYQLKEYDNAWADVNKAEALGDTIDPVFISRLGKSSGKNNNVPQLTGPI